MRRMDGGVIAPTAARLREIASEHRFEISDEEMASFQGLIEGTLPAYRRVAELVEPRPEVTYPRTPGHRPEPSENPFDAWYWKCEVRGSGRGRIANKRIAVKDPVAVAGVPMMAGSAVMEGFVPSIDATIVTRMLDEGGVIAGKSACEDLSISGGAVTCNPRPPRNPVNPAMSAGGSSGGSAALLAAGEVDFAIGTDQGGSTRIPAALCGVVGLKATYGLVPATGVFPLENTIDHVCPMARTSKDVALLLSVIAGDDELDPRMRHAPERKDYTRALTGHAEGMTIALVREGFGWGPEAEKTDAYVRERARRFEKVGAKVVEISLPVHRDAGIVYTPLLMDGIARQLFRGNGFGTGWRGYYPTDWIDYYAKARKTKANSFSHLCKFVLLLGEYMNDEYNGRFYAKAQNIMRGCRQRYDEALAEYDLLLMPTCAPLAQALPQKASYTAEEYVPACFSHHLNTGQFNGTGHPSISLNAGNLDGLPVGMMLTGKWFDEDSVLRAADAYEKLSG